MPSAQPSAQLSPLRPWLPALLWAALIFGLSSVPGDGFPPADLPWEWMPMFVRKNPDKIAHGAEYAILAALCLRALVRGHRFPAGRSAALAILMAAAYGATDEWHQLYVPYRTCELSDWLADVGGAALAAVLMAYFHSKNALTETPSARFTCQI